MPSQNNECVNAMKRYGELNASDRIIFKTLLDLALVLFGSARKIPLSETQEPPKGA